MRTVVCDLEIRCWIKLEFCFWVYFHFITALEKKIGMDINGGWVEFEERKDGIKYFMEGVVQLQDGGILRGWQSHVKSLPMLVLIF